MPNENAHMLVLNLFLRVGIQFDIHKTNIRDLTDN